MGFAGRLAALMAERGIGVRALARRVYCDHALISRYRSGREPPSTKMARLIDTALGAGGELAALAQQRPETPTPGGDDNVKRRELLGAIGGTAGAGPLADRLERLRRSLDGALTAPPTGRDADEWERAAACYAHEVGVLAPADVLPPLLADFGEVADRLRAAVGPVRRRLTHAAAQLGALAAITLTSIGDPQAARRWWRTAARAAGESGDHYAASLILGRHAVFSLYGEPASTLRLAGDAIVAAQGRPCVGVASGYAARAQALAQLGRRDEAARALEDLENVFARLPGDVSGDYCSQWGWSELRLRHVQSYVHTRAADLRAASRAQDAALALYPAAADHTYQGRTQIQMHRAECLIRAGDIDGGTRHAAQVIGALPPGQRQDTLVTLTAMTALRAVPGNQRQRPSVRAAREMLALPGTQG